MTGLALTGANLRRSAFVTPSQWLLAPVIHAPRIHMNGSGKKHLVEKLDNAYDAINKALDALKETAPNARDYYTEGPAALESATTEHRNRMLALSNVLVEIEAIHEGIHENLTEVSYRPRE